LASIPYVLPTSITSPIHSHADYVTVHHEPSYDPRHSHRLFHSARSYLDFRTCQRTSPCGHDTELLDIALHHRPSSLERSRHKGTRVADILAVDGAAELSLLPRHRHVCFVTSSVLSSANISPPVPGSPATADPCAHVPSRLLYTTVRLRNHHSNTPATPTPPIRSTHPSSPTPPPPRLHQLYHFHLVNHADFPAPTVSVQIGNIISSNIYRADDAPLYHRGNSVLIGINILVLLCFLGAKGYYILQNKRREKKWLALSEEERRDYVNNSTDQGNKRLDFRFAH